jgi:hypothetical protein
MRNVSDKSCRENENTLSISNNFFIFKKRAVYEIMWKNVVELGGSQMTWRMRVECWVPKTKNTEYVHSLACQFVM